MGKNLTGYVNVKDEVNYQFIYGTQSKGSFFCIYAKFSLCKKNKNIIKKIDLHLKKYKGKNSFSFLSGNIDYCKIKDGILQLGTKFKKGTGRESDCYSDNLNLEISKFDQLFFTTIKKHYDYLENGDGVPRSIVESSTEDAILADVPYEFDKIAEESVDFIESKTIVGENKSRTEDFSTKAVGGNCRVSLMEVIDG